MLWANSAKRDLPSLSRSRFTGIMACESRDLSSMAWTFAGWRIGSPVNGLNQVFLPGTLSGTSNLASSAYRLCCWRRSSDTLSRTSDTNSATDCAEDPSDPPITIISTRDTRVFMFCWNGSKFSLNTFLTTSATSDAATLSSSPAQPPSAWLHEVFVSVAETTDDVRDAVRDPPRATLG